MPTDPPPRDPRAEAREPALLIVALMLAVATVGATLFAISPLLADIAASFGVGPGRAGTMLSAYGGALAVVAPAVGLLAQRIPRATVIVSGLLVFAAAWIAAGAASGFGALVALTAVAGAATGAVLPAAYAYAADLSSYAQRARVMGRIVSGWSIAILLVVPLMAFASQAIDWRSAFLGLALAAVAAAGLVVVGRRAAGGEGADGADGHGASGVAAPAPVWASLRALLSDPGARRILLANGIDMGAFYAVYAFLGSELRQAHGWGAAQAGLVLACYGAGLSLATFNGRVIDRFGKRRSAIVALLALVAVLSALPWLATRPAAIVAGVVAWGLVQGTFFTAITSLATDREPRLRGVATSLLSCATYLGVTAFTPAGAWLFERFGYGAVGAASGASCLAAAWLLRPTASPASSSR